MQKKVKNSKHNAKKASLRDASKEVRRNSIFNYDLEVESDKEQKQKAKRIQKNQARRTDEDQYIGMKELTPIKRNPIINEIKNNKEGMPKVDQKKLDKIKKQKKKENFKKKKAIKKQEIREEKQRNEHKKKMTSHKAKMSIQLKKKIKIIALILLVIIAILLFLLSPIFNIKEVQVVGNSKISKERIISLSEIQNGSNSYRISKREVKSNIKKEPYIRKVTVKRILPSSIEIIVEERILEYLFEFAGSYAYIGSEAYILEISGENIEDKIKIKGYSTTEEKMKPGNRLCTEDIDSLNDVIQIMEYAKNNGLDSYIDMIDISDKTDYILYINSEKKRVHLGDTSNLDTKMPYIKVIMEREKDIEGEIFVNVDLRNKYPYFSENVYK